MKYAIALTLGAGLIAGVPALAAERPHALYGDPVTGATLQTKEDKPPPLPKDHPACSNRFAKYWRNHRFDYDTPPRWANFPCYLQNFRGPLLCSRHGCLRVHFNPDNTVLPDIECKGKICDWKK